MKTIDMIGRRFGRLVGISRAGLDAEGLALWLFQCDCGGQVVATGSRVKRGRTQSCGCLRPEATAQSNVKKKTTHGESTSIEYRIWGHMRERCTNPKHKSFPRYGGRGIAVCARWDDFNNFLCDMGRRPSLMHSIDRIDNDGNYEPGNCRWSLPSEQGKNRSDNKIDAEIAARIRLAHGSQESIAAEFGVSQSLVSLVKTGKAWTSC